MGAKKDAAVTSKVIIYLETTDVNNQDTGGLPTSLRKWYTPLLLQKDTTTLSSNLHNFVGQYTLRIEPQPDPRTASVGELCKVE